MRTDQMHFKDLFFDVHIGCFEPERKNRQKLKLEFTADVPSIALIHLDDPEQIILDYAVVSKILADYFHKNEFRLLETAAEGVAHLLLKEFCMNAVRIYLTKYPQDMPKGSSITYECSLSRKI